MSQHKRIILTAALLLGTIATAGGQESTRPPSKEALVFLIAGQSNAGGVAAFSPETNEKSGMAAKHPTIPGSTDVVAGISSLILTLTDRIAGAGGAAPLAVILRDCSNQRILHRIFTAGGARFLLTAVCKGDDVATDTLDPALGALETVLSAG